MIEHIAERIVQPADGLVVDMTSDLICPWCFVAKRRLEKASLILGKTLDIRWHPFQLNPEMPVQRRPRSPNVPLSARGFAGVGNSRNGSMRRCPPREPRLESDFAMT